MIKSRLIGASCAVAFSFISMSVNASFVAYTDRTAFLNAASGTSLDTTNFDFTTNPGSSFTMNAGASSVSMVLGGWSQWNAGGFFENSQSYGNTRLNAQGNPNVVGAVAGIGFDYTMGDSTFAPDARIGYTPNGGSAILLREAGNSGFFGILSTDGDSIQHLQELGAEIWNGSSTLDNVTIVSAVPVPAAAWLFGSGLVGLVGVARRRKSA